MDINEGGNQSKEYKTDIFCKYYKVL